MPQLDTSLRCTERSGAWYNENSSKNSSERGLMPNTMYFCSLLASALIICSKSGRRAKSPVVAPLTSSLALLPSFSSYPYPCIYTISILTHHCSCFVVLVSSDVSWGGQTLGQTDAFMYGESFLYQ
jgi:hypothetical protein